MAKSELLNQPQNIRTASVGFNSSDTYGVWNVAPTAAGTNLTTGTRTFTAAAGTVISGGSNAATWTMPAISDGSNVFVSGVPAITNRGQYKSGAGPTAVANAATVDSGTSDATFALSVGIVKLLFTAGAEGAVVPAITAVNSDPNNSRTVTLLRQDAGSDELNPILHGVVPANAGIAGDVGSCDLLAASRAPGAPRDANNKPVLKLSAGAKLYATVPSVTAGTYMRVNITVEDFAV